VGGEDRHGPHRREGVDQTRPLHLRQRPPPVGRGDPAVEQRGADHVGAQDVQCRHPGRPGQQEREGERGGPFPWRSGDVACCRTEDEPRYELGVAAPQQLRDEPSHRVTHRDQPFDAELRGHGGDVVGAVLQPEVRGPEAIPVPAQVEHDHAVAGPERFDDPAPVQLRRESHPVQQDERVGAGRARSVLDDRAPATREVQHARADRRQGPRAAPVHSDLLAVARMSPGISSLLPDAIFRRNPATRNRATGFRSRAARTTMGQVPKTPSPR
jgi:hypothetical protein